MHEKKFKNKSSPSSFAERDPFFAEIKREAYESNNRNDFNGLILSL